MSRIKPHLYKLVRTYNLLLALLPSIAFYRATVQPDYKWGLLAIHGKGMSSEYWYLVVFMIVAWVTFILEKWHKRKWYYMLPIFLFSLVAVIVVFGYSSQNEMVFQGDVWKFKFEMGLLFVIVTVLLMFAAIVWSVLDLKDFKTSDFALSKSNRLKLIAAMSISIVIFWLFAQGRGGEHSITDGIAVGLVVIQALFLSYIIDSTG